MTIEDTIAKYYFGSEDSIDKDICYVVRELPSISECKKFCSEDESENRNIIAINNGIITDCYKGTPDETNNALLRTYELHSQKYPLLITEPLERDVFLKIIRTTRVILSFLSRTTYRKDIKEALTDGSLLKRMRVLNNISLSKEALEPIYKTKKKDINDIVKVLAFQIGQTLALIDGKECYTKSEIKKEFPLLRTALDRISIDNNYEIINAYLSRLCKEINKLQWTVDTNDKNIVWYLCKKYDVKDEKKISEEPYNFIIKNNNGKNVVWVVLSQYNDNTSEVNGIFESKEKAENMADFIKNHNLSEKYAVSVKINEMFIL